MTEWVNLGEPFPKEIYEDYQPFYWECSESISLPYPIVINEININSLVQQRRTQREFKKIDLNIISTLLWNTHKILSFGESLLSFSISYRPVASAGGIHPISILVNDNNNEWYVYNGLSHSLDRLRISEVLAELRSDIVKVLDPQLGVLLFFVAEPYKTLAKYENGCSLVWRDAGVILGHVSLFAEAMNLNFCPLGVTGDSWAKKINSEKLVGVGMGIIGAR